MEGSQKDGYRAVHRRQVDTVTTAVHSGYWLADLAEPDHIPR